MSAKVLAFALSLAPTSALLLGCAEPLSAASQPDELFQSISFEAALERAANEEKVVFVDFFTTWCQPCKKLDATTWKDERVVTWLSGNSVPLKIDAEQEVALAARYRVAAYPTMVFIDSQGEELGRLVGYLSAEDFLVQGPEAKAGITELERLDAKLAETPNDPMMRQDRGELLMREGRYEEALEELLWCFDEGEEHGRGYGGVRRSFLTSSLASLARAYPPAMEAMLLRASSARDRVLGGEGGFDECQDASALYRALGDHAAMLSMWEALPDSFDSPGLKIAKDSLFDDLLDYLIREEMYETILAGAGDVRLRIEEEISKYRQMSSFYEGRDVEEGMPDPTLFMRKRVVEAGSIYFHALVAMKRFNLADEVAVQLIDFDGSGSTYGKLIRAAAEVGAFEMALDLLHDGFDEVSEDDQASLRMAERKVERLMKKAKEEESEHPDGSRGEADG